jgi:hypothetical protein
MGFITNQMNPEGFGSQYQRIVYTILYADFLNKEFVYSKPNLNIVYDDEECEYIENIMNISKFFKSVDEIDQSNLEICDFNTARNVIESNIDYYAKSDTMKKIIYMFKENKKIDIFDNTCNNVCIHIRRPSLHKNIDLPAHHNFDVKNNNLQTIVNISPRFTLDDYYLSIISTIRNSYTSKKNIFHIVSEGSIENFKNFISDDIIFHLNKDLNETMVLMATSDMFVMSNSSFSYIGALLNENKIIYKEGFWCPKVSHWLIPADIQG